jgi:hypothetical protein
MNRFMTRLLLNGYPTAEQFEKLHKEMKKRGFTRVIEGSDSKYYWLPNGTYYRVTNSTHNQVFDDATAAAATVTTEYELVVSEAPSSKWVGLKLASKADSQAA